MLGEFAYRIKHGTGKLWISKKHCIRYVILVKSSELLFMFGRCLAHVCHLATRALISTHSKAPFYDPESADVGLSEANGFWDEIGLVRAIVVKVSLWILYKDITYACSNLGLLLCSEKAALSWYPKAVSKSTARNCSDPALTWHAYSMVINLWYDWSGWEEEEGKWLSFIFNSGS